MEPFAENIPAGLTSILSSLIGGGIVYWALVGKLAEKFATKVRIEEVAEAVEKVSDIADNQREQLTRLTTIAEQQQATNSRLEEGQGTITMNLQALAVSHARTEEAVSSVAQRLAGD